jgi:hypothetical protein
MKNCDTFIRHIYEWAAAESCSADFLRRMLHSIAKRLYSEAALHSCFAGQHEDTDQTRLKGKTALDGAARAVMRAVPLLNAGTISRRAQYIC